MPQSLKRLGGGRWETRDGRFSIEPQSGTWVVVDNEQTNELGLPLVRGPFPSLAAARQSVDEVREAGPMESPLAARLEEARRAPPQPAKDRSRSARKPAPPREPRWMRELDERDLRRAKALVRRLTEAGVDDPEGVARAQVADGEPALARLALERALTSAVDEDDPRSAVRRAVESLLSGHDEALGARWRIVDDEDREIRRLDIG